MKNKNLCLPENYGFQSKIFSNRRNKKDRKTHGRTLTEQRGRPHEESCCLSEQSGFPDADNVKLEFSFVLVPFHFVSDLVERLVYPDFFIADRLVRRFLAHLPKLTISNNYVWVRYSSSQLKIKFDLLPINRGMNWVFRYPLLSFSVIKSAPVLSVVFVPIIWNRIPWTSLRVALSTYRLNFKRFVVVTVVVSVCSALRFFRNSWKETFPDCGLNFVRRSQTDNVNFVLRHRLFIRPEVVSQFFDLVNARVRNSALCQLGNPRVIQLGFLGYFWPLALSVV
jgi:hypothetical protein